jgi:hypothetical protein
MSLNMCACYRIIIGWGVLAVAIAFMENVHARPYLVPGVFSGLTNQRLSILRTLAFAKDNDFTLVLPHWQSDCE